MNENDQNQNMNHGTILKELSDIKSSLAVNTSETANIKQTLNEVKVDIREIKQDFISRREFTEGLDAVREEITPLRRFVYGIITTVGIAVLAAVLKFVIK